jgi:hypothetical protein
VRTVASTDDVRVVTLTLKVLVTVAALGGVSLGAVVVNREAGPTDAERGARRTGAVQETPVGASCLPTGRTPGGCLPVLVMVPAD